MNDFGASDRGFRAGPSTGFALPELALQGVCECLDAAGIDGRLPARYIEAASVSGPACPGTEGEVDGRPVG